MRSPGVQCRFVLVAGAIVFAFIGGVCAEQPPGSSDSKTVKVPSTARTKPQRIFHVRPASNYAATLHSQQKTQNNDLPIDDSMPTSLQLSRANANAEARAQQESPAPEQEQPAPQQRSVKHQKMQKVRVVRAPGVTKSKAHGKGHKH